MNLLLLAIGFRVWSGSALEIVTRVFAALSFFSLEMQAATWTGAGTLQSLVLVNIVVAAAAWFGLPRALPCPAVPPVRVPRAWTALVPLAGFVLILNILLPLEAADPYHFDRAFRIARLGTLSYDPAADPKLNIMGWLYELVLADVYAIPFVGGAALKLHGVGGVLLFGAGIVAVCQILGITSAMVVPLTAVVPVLFHQFVMIKNDLLGAIPALLVLAWLVGRAREAGSLEIAWAAWLAGVAIGIKPTTLPLAVIAVGALALDRRFELRVLGAGVAGALVGAASGGVLFMLVENARVYGSSLAPFALLGNETAGVRGAFVSVGRFILSLVDMGLVTPRWWPGRGGWGSTFGLPMIWSLAAIAIVRSPRALRALTLAGAYWLMFAAEYADADIAHRLALAPGLLITAVAADAVVADADRRPPMLLRRAVIPVIALSVMQIVRSGFLYFQRT